MKILKLFTFMPLILLLMSASNCSGLQYKSDGGLMAPFQAQVMEFPVKVNGNICKDMSGSIGACTLMLSHRNDLKIEIMPQAYAYNVQIACSSSVNFEYSADVPIGTSHVVEITDAIYADVDHFICIGKMTPEDRDFISSRWEMRIRLSDENYVRRVNIFIFEDNDKLFISVGKHAKYSWIYDKENWKLHWKQPIIEIKGDRNKLQAYSESEIMRFNFFNM